MAKKKIRSVRSVYRDLFPEDQTAEMEMRSLLLLGLERWLADSAMTQTEAAKVLGVTQTRVGALGNFLDALTGKNIEPLSGKKWQS